MLRIVPIERRSSGLSPSWKTCRMARETFRLRFECPGSPEQIVPGQFVMLRLAGANDPLLARPLALYDTVLDAASGPWPRRRLPGGRQADRPAGPLGPGARWRSGARWATAFRPTPAEHLVMVAGGIGQTPFLALARRVPGPSPAMAIRPAVPPAARRVTLCYGAR